MTDEQIEKLAALLESLGSQEVTSTSGVLQSELFAAASAIRQLMRERDTAVRLSEYVLNTAQTIASVFFKRPLTPS